MVVVAGVACAFTAVARTVKGRPALWVLPPTAVPLASERVVPAAAQSASVTLKLANDDGRMAKLSLEQATTVAVPVAG